MSNYEEKYKKALKSIEDIIKANKQIKDQLDALRLMRQNDVESFANIQKEEFKKAYDALLKEKNTLYISYQTLELENQKLKYTVSELESQVSLYKNERTQKLQEQRQTLLSNQQPEALNTEHPSPKKSDTKDMSAILRQKEAQFHRTIENYEEHHSNLQRNCKRLQERIGQLQNKLMSTQKNWRVKYQAKELQVIDIKALTRQQFSEQITLLRKQNSSLKLLNNDLSLKIENIQKNTQFNKNLQNYDWQAELVQQMIHVKANLEPLRQQINELQEINVYQKEQSIRQRTNLQTRVLQLESEVERQNETIKQFEKKSLESYQQRRGIEQKQQLLKKYEEQNQLLNGKIIVMQSREIALRNRTGQQLQERVLQFENRIELLLNNKEGLRELREVGIHQLLALKAYIMELDSKLKELMLSNAYLLKKYKSYKEKYQGSLKEHKQYGMTINSLKMKILGYDKLVVKLQGELQRMVRSNQPEYIPRRNVKQSNDNEIYKKKYELMKEKLEIQQKYKEQQMETFKLNYQTKIMQLTIRIEQVKSLKETIELYRTKNQQLQGLLSKKQTQLFQSKILSNSKVNASQNQPLANTRQTKDMISNLHITLKQNDETIFKLQSELRNKEDNYKRTITKLQREVSDLKQDHARALSKKEMDYSITLDQQIKKYKIKINELEHNYHIVNINHKDQHSKKTEEVQGKIRKLQARLQQAQSKREEQVFNRRRMQKQIIDLSHDKQQLQRGNNELQLRINQYKSIQREYQQLKIKQASSKQQSKQTYLDYELQSKDTIIKRLNNQIFELKSSLSGLGEKDITISSQKNEIYYLKKQIEELNDTINKYNNQITFLKGTLDTNKVSYNNQFSSILEEKDNVIGRLRRDLTTKENKNHQYEQEVSNLEETVRKLKRDSAELQRAKQQMERFDGILLQKDKAIQKLKSQSASYEDQIQNLNRELTYIKQNYQKLNYELLQKNDQLSKLHLQQNTISIRTKQTLESKYMQELLQREKQISKLNSDLSTLRSNCNMMQQDRNYHQQNYKRANNDIFNLRGQINQLEEENTDLSNQMYYKSQEISKLQYNIESYKQQIQDLTQKSEQNYKIRTQIFSLKSDISNLQQQIFNKQAANARLSNEINYIRSQFMQMQEELSSKQDFINKITYQYNSLKGNHDEIDGLTQEKDKYIQKINNELNSLRNKYRDLEEEMEERQQAFSMLNQELNKLKSNLNYYEDQIQERNTQISKSNNEKQILKAQIVRLNQTIGDKNQELNKAKQQIFSIRLQSSQKDYNEKMRIDQEMYSLKNRINLLQHQIQDRDSQIRRLGIEMDTVRHQPQPQPSISQEQIQQLQGELSKKQRQLINMRFDLEDRQYQLQTMTNNATMLRNTLNQYQQRMISERQEYERTIRECNQKERRLQQQISLLNEELEKKAYIPQAPKSYSFTTTYTQQQMNTVKQQYNVKQRELNALKYELQDKLYILQSLQSKAKMQENLLHQIQQQYNEDRQHYELQIQEQIKQQRQLRKNMQQLQEHYEQQLRNQKAAQSYTPSASPYDQTLLLRQYVQQIDRLNKIIKELQEDIQAFKLKLSSMINQQNRIQENLVTMVLLFTEVQSIRDRIKSKETEIGEVRRSFMQMAVSGEIEANKMSRLMGLVNNNNINSEEKIENESVDKQSVNVFSQIEEAHEQMERSKQPEFQNHAQEHLKEYIEEYVQDNHQVHREIEDAPVNQSVEEEGEGVQQSQQTNLVVVQKQTVQRGGSEVSSSLIQQLQKEEVGEGSQVRGGQITIKIPSQQQYIPTTNIVQQVPYNKVIQIQPQYIQMGGARVIQSIQPQQVYISQSGTPYARQIIQTSPTQSAVIQSGAIPQQANIPRPINYYSMAAPINPQPFRPIP